MKRQYLSLVLTITLCFCNVTFSSAKNDLPPIDEDNALTTQLLQDAKEFKKDRGPTKRSREERLIALAKKRAERLEKMMAKNPEAFLLHALPKEVGGELPSVIQEYIERHSQLEGKMDVVAAIAPSTEKEFILYTLITKEGKKFNVHFGKKAPHGLATGSTLKADGVMLNNNFVVAQASAGGTTATATTTSTGTTAVAAGPVTRSVAVILVSFQDTPNPLSPSDVQYQIFNAPNSQNEIYKATSYGNLSLSGGNTIYSVTIPYNASGNGCIYSTWDSAADSAAAKQGFSINNYMTRLHLYPYNDCSPSMGGVAQVGSGPTAPGLWANNFYAGWGGWVTTVYHEIGHNIGMWHASTSTDTYGDTSDFMGNNWISTSSINAVHRFERGWIAAQTLQDGGSYPVTLMALHSTPGSSTNPQIVKIMPVNGTTPLYISYREPVGFDSGLNGGYSFMTNIHSWSGSGNTFFVTSLADGQSYTDATSGVTITQHSHDLLSHSANVNVTLSGPVCTSQAPVMNINPVSRSGNAGNALQYTVTVSNTDTSCSNVTYNLSADVPAGWTGSFSPSSLSIASGSSANATLTVKSVSTATEGSYQFTATATGSNGVASKNAAYIVTIINQAPVVNAGIDQTLSLPDAVNLTGVVTDDALPNNVVTTAWSKASGTGTVTFGNSSQATTTASFSTAGSYVLRLTANDGALTSSDDVIITVKPPLKANAGNDQTITLKRNKKTASVTLDGSASTGAIVSYNWAGNPDPANVARTSVTLGAGTYTFTLTVTDSKGTSLSDSVNITVKSR